MDVKLKNEFMKTFFRLQKIKSRFLASKDIAWSAIMLLKKLDTDGNTDGICDLLHITKPAVTYMLNSLEKDGCIIRNIDANDRRRIEINLTDKGRKLVETHKIQHERYFNELLTRLGDKNVRNYIKLINRFADVMDEVKEDLENE